MKYVNRSCRPVAGVTSAAITTITAVSNKRKRARGQGSIYLRGDRAIYWIKYKDASGKTVPESTGTKNYAKAMLESKIARIAMGEYVAPKAQNVTVNDIGVLAERRTG